MVGLGFIGATSIAWERHAPEALARPDVDIVGFYNRTEKKAQDFAARFGGKAFASEAALLDAPGLNAVVISTANSLHYPQAMQALEKGRHVLLEKPMTVTAEEGEALTRTAREKGLVLMIAHNLRLEPVFRRARAILDSGVLGRVLSFSMQVGCEGPAPERDIPAEDLWFYDRAAAGMGVMGDIGVHGVDTLHYLLGGHFTEVSCFAGAIDKTYADGRPVPVEDNAVCLLKTGDGKLGTLSASWSYYDGWTSATTLFCQKGVLRLNQPGGAPLQISDLSGRMRTEDPGGGGHDAAGSGIMQMFIGAVEAGRAPELDGEVGLAALRVCVAALRSAETGRPARVE